MKAELPVAFSLFTTGLPHTATEVKLTPAGGAELDQFGNCVSVDLIFYQGFESGDTSAWSAVVP